MFLAHLESLNKFTVNIVKTAIKTLQKHPNQIKQNRILRGP